jgi:hypothetical protein
MPGYAQATQVAFVIELAGTTISVLLILTSSPPS